MNMAVPDLNGPDWKTLYRAAILETNQSTLQQRVSEAEEAVIKRGREIFYEHATLEEQQALADALYVLLALRAAWQHAGGDGHASIRFSVPVLQKAYHKKADSA